MDTLRLFTYKLTHDTGFAPCPFHGYLTLANCKPLIRKHKNIGDWIAGFTSKKLKIRGIGDEVGSERLIYLMQVTEKLTYAEYWNDERFKNKIPHNLNETCLLTDKARDNIYEPSVDAINGFNQIKNSYHELPEMARDLSGKYVLVSKVFYYFGASALVIDQDIRPKVPKTQSAHGVRTHDSELAAKFIKHITNKYKVGIYDHPIKWDSSDESWRDDENYIK